jgi:hypothetical protein
LRFVVGLFVNANAIGLDDPEAPGNRLGVQHTEEVAHELFQQAERRAFREPENGDAGRSVRRKADDIREVEVQRDQTAPFPNADFEEELVVYLSSPRRRPF